MTSIDKMKTDGTWETLNKRERLFKTRQREKLDKNFGSIADMTRQPAAIFIVDIVKEHIALKEAKRLNVPVFAMVDTNSNPKLVDFPIPANDDATKSIAIILDEICGAVKEGLEERKNAKDAAKDEAPKAKKEAVKEEAPKAEAKEEAATEAPAEEAKAEEVVEAPAAEAATEEAPAAEEAKADESAEASTEEAEKEA
jgi:small subunit ribosomal protein S2